jgi:nitroreductase
MTDLPDPLAVRRPDHPIEPLFVRRWSPRAMSGAPLPQDRLLRLFEAARWAPSSYNEQEWRFRYAHRGTAHWPLFFGLLAEANQVWCKDAAVLVVVAAKTTFTRNGSPNPVHAFDAGAAFENLCLQAAAMGLVAHGMAGFDRERARTELRMPADVAPQAMIAIGHPGSVASLPEKLRAIETPSGRKKVAEFAGEGPFAG